MADEPALEQFYRQQHQRLYRYAYRIVRQRELAADLVHEALARSLPRFVGQPGTQAVPPERWAAYLFRTVHNLAVNSGLRAREQPVDPGDLVPVAAGGEMAERVAVVHQLAGCLAALSEQERAAYLLNHEGLTQREIAECIGIGPDAVYRRVRTAQRKLRRCLEGVAER